MAKNKIINFFKKKYRFAITYAILLVGCTTYLLLDNYVLAKKMMEIDNDRSQELAEEFSKDAIITDNSFENEFIKLKIDKIRKHDTDIFIADVKLKDISYLKTAFAKDSYGRNIIERTSQIAERNAAIFAVNGDFYGFRDKGYVVRNGVVYCSERQEKKFRDDMAIYKDGSMEVFKEYDYDLDYIYNKGAVHVFTFGPELVRNGEVVENTIDQKLLIENPRCAMGIVENLHYIFIVTDGRIEASKGLTVEQLSNLFLEYNVKDAYNFDGGGSTSIWFNGKLLNTPCDGAERAVSDIVYIGY